MAKRAQVREPRRPPLVPPTKQQAILAAAHRVFVERGYGDASMDAIANLAGVSKQTVYSHFNGKEALFSAIIKERCAQLLEFIPVEAATAAEPEETLRGLARRYLSLVLAPGNIEYFRVVIAECGRFPELAEAFYRAGPLQATNNLATLLAGMSRNGLLSVPDPEASARLFFGMLRGDLWMRRLLALGAEESNETVDRLVEQVVKTFLLAHCPTRSHIKLDGTRASVD